MLSASFFPKSFSKSRPRAIDFIALMAFRAKSPITYCFIVAFFPGIEFVFLLGNVSANSS